MEGLERKRQVWPANVIADVLLPGLNQGVKHMILFLRDVGSLLWCCLLQNSNIMPLIDEIGPCRFTGGRPKVPGESIVGNTHQTTCPAGPPPFENTPIAGVRRSDSQGYSL